MTINAPSTTQATDIPWLGETTLYEQYAIVHNQVLQQRFDNFALWESCQEGMAQFIESWRDHGWEGPPLWEEALVQRFAPPVPSLTNDELSTIRAMFKDGRESLYKHIAYRHEKAGNTHISCLGMTGMAKSSCLIGLADEISNIPRGHLTEYLAFDQEDLPTILSNKKPGETVIQDEVLKVAGEGSFTIGSMFDNLEDTLRASGVNMFRISPRRQDAATMQAELEVIAWNPDQRKSLFLCYAYGYPSGILSLDWMDETLYEEYKPWKAANVERTKEGLFRSSGADAKRANVVLREPRFISFLTRLANKPRLKDFKMAVRLYPATMMTAMQQDALADFVHDVCYSWDRVKDEYEQQFGIKPHEGFAEIAKKCYDE